MYIKEPRPQGMSLLITQRIWLSWTSQLDTQPLRVEATNIFLIINYDSNFINEIPTKSQKSDEMVRVLNICYEELIMTKSSVRILKLDNELPKDLIKVITVIVSVPRGS